MLTSRRKATRQRITSRATRHRCRRLFAFQSGSTSTHRSKYSSTCQCLLESNLKRCFRWKETTSPQSIFPKEIRVRAEKARCGGTCVESSRVKCPRALPAPKAHCSAARAENSRVKTCEGWGNMSNIIPRSRCKCQLAFFFNPNQKVIIAIGAVQRGKKKRLLWGEGAVAVVKRPCQCVVHFRLLRDSFFASPKSELSPLEL